MNAWPGFAARIDRGIAEGGDLVAVQEP